jgi:hypothetical protein
VISDLSLVLPGSRSRNDFDDDPIQASFSQTKQLFLESNNDDDTRLLIRWLPVAVVCLSVCLSAPYLPSFKVLAENAGKK